MNFRARDTKTSQAKIRRWCKNYSSKSGPTGSGRRVYTTGFGHERYKHQRTLMKSRIETTCRERYPRRTWRSQRESSDEENLQRPTVNAALALSYP